jgi:non-ribosomal peptide synthetase component F
LPFEVVVEALQPERNTSYTPIFQVMIVLQNAPQRVEKVAGIELRGIEGEQTTAKFDLTLFVEEQGQQMVCSMEYNTDLFNDSTITRLLGYFQALLQSIVEDPDGEIETLPMITEEESQQLVEAWS